MKNYKIKKRNIRITPYIADDPKPSFRKPNLPLWYFSKVNKPNLFEKQDFIFEQEPVLQKEQEQQQQV